jgi:hypothetical protein
MPVKIGLLPFLEWLAQLPVTEGRCTRAIGLARWVLGGRTTKPPAFAGMTGKKATRPSQMNIYHDEYLRDGRPQAALESIDAEER